MSNEILAFIFFFALSSAVYFIGRLVSWSVHKLSSPLYQEDTTLPTVVGLVSIILWSLLFYYL